MEKNKQVLEFGDIIKESSCSIFQYSILRSMFLDYIEFIAMDWDTYKNSKSQKEIMDDYKYFSEYVYLPF